MAEYGYSMPYSRTNIQPLPPGYMEAATAPGRMWAQALGNVGQNIGAAIQQYRTNKAEHEASAQTMETLSGLTQQALASDPKYQALQKYYETGQLPSGVTENDVNRFAQSVQADRAMLNKMADLGGKFNDMSLAKKKAAIGDMAMVLNQYQNRTAADTQRMNAEIERMKLEQLRAETAGASELPAALREAIGVTPGQAPQAPFKSVEAGILSRYPNLTPSQMQAVLGTIQQRKQTVPAGMVPKETTVGGVTYERAPSTTVTSQEIPNTGMAQTFVGDKPVGAPVKIDRSINAQNDYAKMPEALQKVTDAMAKDFRNEKTLINAQLAGGFLGQLEALGSRVGTPEYKASDDIALIFSFMKTLDPGSTVREGEFATAQNAGGVPERILNMYNKSLSGKFLTDEQRKDFISTAKSNYSGLLKEAQKTAEGYRKSAKDRGIPEYLVIPETFGEAIQQAGTGQSVEEKKTSGGVNYRVKRN